jgi:hypothetical protein
LIQHKQKFTKESFYPNGSSSITKTVNLHLFLRFVPTAMSCRCLKGVNLNFLIAPDMSNLCRLTLLHSSLLFVLALPGCAPRGVNYHVAAYKDCVFSQSMDMIDSPQSAEDIAKIAAAQCQGNLTLINEKLREDNAWMEQYGSNSDAHVEKIRDKTNADVVEEIKKIRAK